MIQRATSAVLAGVVFLGLSLATVFSHAAEDKWPSGPITTIVPFGAGGGMDMTARSLSEEMKKTLGVPMAVVNVTGGGGAIGMEQAYRQPKDGNTLFALSSAVCTYPATGLSKLTYKEFGLLGIAYEALPVYSVAYDSPIKTMNDLIQGLKKGGLTGSNSGFGGVWHVPQIIVNSTIGGNFKVVPYDGGAPSALAAAKKEVDFATCDVAEAQTYFREKLLRPLCVVDDKPFNLGGVGTIPPVTDFIPEMKDKLILAKGWRAVGYVKGIPKDRVEKLIQAFKTALATDMVKNFAAKNLLVINGTTGAEADQIFAKTTQTLSWLLYDLKAAKRSPDELGIPRPGK